MSSGLRVQPAEIGTEAGVELRVLHPYPTKEMGPKNIRFEELFGGGEVQVDDLYDGKN